MSLQGIGHRVRSRPEILRWLSEAELAELSESELGDALRIVHTNIGTNRNWLLQLLGSLVVFTGFALASMNGRLLVVGLVIAYTGGIALVTGSIIANRTVRKTSRQLLAYKSLASSRGSARRTRPEQGTSPPEEVSEAPRRSLLRRYADPTKVDVCAKCGRGRVPLQDASRAWRTGWFHGIRRFYIAESPLRCSTCGTIYCLYCHVQLFDEGCRACRPTMKTQQVE